MKMPPRACCSVNLPEATTHLHTNPPQFSTPRGKKKGGWEEEFDLNMDIFLSPPHMTAQDGAEGHIHPKNQCCRSESFTMALSLRCFWQDGITHADLSMNGTIWVHSFTVTCKLHSLYILCIFETMQMNWSHRGRIEPVPLTIPQPWSDSPFLQENKPCKLG